MNYPPNYPQQQPGAPMGGPPGPPMGGGPFVPPNPGGARGKSNLPIILAGVGAVVLLLGIVLFFALRSGKGSGKWGLPLDAKQLPSQTDMIGAEAIDGTRETDPHVRQMYTAAELGSEICHAGSSDPARQIEVLGVIGSAGAKHFFETTNLQSVQSLLECGELLNSNLDSPFQTALGFNDETNTKQEVGILKLKATDIPAKFGFSKHAFSGLDGFCRTSDPNKPNVPAADCAASSEAAVHQGSTWFLGKRAALDMIAHAITNPKTDLSTEVAALNDAAAATEGLSAERIQSQITSSKSFFMNPCYWGSFQTAGSISDFMSGCFPSTVDKMIQDIDAKLRAAAFEIDADVVKANAVHGNIVLVARDSDAAKEVEKDATDIISDWKSTLENNEAKLIKQAQTNAVSLRQKNWAIIVDNFAHAIEKMKVIRSGRAVRLNFNEPLAADDKKDLDAADMQTRDKRVAVADILDAIEQKKTLPADALSKLIGPQWATYFAQSAQTSSTPPAPKVALSGTECKQAKKSAAKMKLRDMPTKEASSLLLEVQRANCNNPPQVQATTRNCLASGFATPQDFAKCAPPPSAGSLPEPPESAYGIKP